MRDDGTPTVLIVDDEPEVRDGHAAALADEYDVLTAASGEAALATLDESVDVLLLDRRMPGLDGETVLERVRADGNNCWVAMLTGVEPDFDIIGMGFDDYLVKPVTAEALRDTVEALLRRAEYDASLRRYFSLASKVALLETEHDRADLATEESYAQLCGELSRRRQELDEVLDDLSVRDRYAVAAGRPGN